MSDTTTLKKPATAAEVRAWARGRGFDVGNRGHLSSDVVARFNNAHRSKEFINSNPMVAPRS